MTLKVWNLMLGIPFLFCVASFGNLSRGNEPIRIEGQVTSSSFSCIVGDEQLDAVKVELWLAGNSADITCEVRVIKACGCVPLALRKQPSDDQNRKIVLDIGPLSMHNDSEREVEFDLEFVGEKQLPLPIRRSYKIILTSGLRIEHSIHHEVDLYSKEHILRVQTPANDPLRELGLTTPWGYNSFKPSNDGLSWSIDLVATIPTKFDAMEFDTRYQFPLHGFTKKDGRKIESVIDVTYRKRGDYWWVENKKYATTSTDQSSFVVALIRARPELQLPLLICEFDGRSDMIKVDQLAFTNHLFIFKITVKNLSAGEHFGTIAIASSPECKTKLEIIRSK